MLRNLEQNEMKIIIWFADGTEDSHDHIVDYRVQTDSRCLSLSFKNGEAAIFNMDKLIGFIVKPTKNKVEELV